jgi:hypothetical protein
MPNPLLYLAAQAAAAIAGALIVLAIGIWHRPASASRMQAGSVLGIASGLAAGFCVLQLRIAWPPVNGLDRFLAIILPVALGIVLAAALPCVPRGVAWALRLALVAALGRILLHGSVYLGGVHMPWTPLQAVASLVACAVLTAAVWLLLAWLAQRSPVGVSIPLALAMTLQTAGLAIMLAGYLKGGSAAFPLSAAIVGTSCAAWLLSRQADPKPAIGLGVVGLSGLLLIGRFFGGLSTGVALLLLLAPLLCWWTELPGLRRWPGWFVGSLRVLFVAVPLVAILIQAKLDFDRETAPLLGQRRATMPMRSATSASGDPLAASRFAKR